MPSGCLQCFISHNLVHRENGAPALWAVLLCHSHLQEFNIMTDSSVNYQYTNGSWHSQEFSGNYLTWLMDKNSPLLFNKLGIWQWAFTSGKDTCDSSNPVTDELTLTNCLTLAASKLQKNVLGRCKTLKIPVIRNDSVQTPTSEENHMYIYAGFVWGRVNLLPSSWYTVVIWI